MDTVNNITLKYLLNQSLYDKILNKEENNEELLLDLQFYKKRIVNITKKMCKNNFENEILKSAFLSYVTSLIYFFKSNDKKDIIQAEYLDGSGNNIYNIKNKVNNNNNNNNSNSDLFKCNEAILTKKKDKITLDKFVSERKSNEEKIIPLKKEIDLQDPKLKVKGLKKKSVVIIETKTK